MTDPLVARRRREPPPFRRVRVARVTDRTPHLRRITLRGPELQGFDPGLPAASVRLLVPTRGVVEVPAWDGNEFLRSDGTRPAIRTLTPLDHRPERHELDVEVVLHGAGPLSRWAEGAQPEDEAAVSGTGRGYEIGGEALGYVLAGDESAIPAIGMLLDAIGGRLPVHVLVEVARADARLDLPGATSARWLDLDDGEPPGGALLPAMADAEIPTGTLVWAAGEAAAMQRVRTLLFEHRGLDRGDATVRGYWKVGRASGGS